MKNSFKKIFAVMMIAIMVIMSAIPVYADTLLDNNKTVSFTMNCTKPGYTFNVYKVATLSSTTSNPYETKYTSLIPSASSANVTKAIVDGNTADLLASLDAVETIPTSAPVVGTFTTSATSTTKTLTDLPQGIYYVRAENFPAGVQSVTNSVFALPYYKDSTSGWTYTIDDIELAGKVFDKDIETKKEITNSTKGNVNFTDVSLGDTVNFEIRSTVTGSTSMKLNSYLVTDDMSKGLTLNKDSFNIALLKEDGTKITDLSDTEYTVTYTEGFDGTDLTKNTKFTIALTKAYLQTDEFYGSDVFYTSITYSAVLNKNAVTGATGNPNTEGKIEYSNKNDVTVSHEGNTVYVYTYAVAPTKVDPDNKPLAGATFELYKTQADVNAQKNAIATGVSDSTGKVAYLNAKGEEIRLQSGTYYTVETVAPSGYNLYGKVITIDATASYTDTFTNGSYVVNCPEDGVVKFSVTNTKLITPQTGGEGNGTMYIFGGIIGVVGCLALALGLVVSKKRKKDGTQA